MSVNIKRDNDIIIYEIDDVANTFEVEMARKGFERKNHITNHRSLYTWFFIYINEELWYNNTYKKGGKFDYVRSNNGTRQFTYTK